MLPMTSYVRLNENQTPAPLRGSVVCYLWPGKHRRHIRRLPVVLRAGLCAAIFTKRVCRTPYGIVRRLLAFMSVNGYIVSKN